jgi:hypothetical protein
MGIRDIGSQKMSASPTGTDGFGGIFTRNIVLVIDKYFCPRSRQRQRTTAANPFACTRDQCHASI